ncbi:MAG: hypothetical protein KatS3mg115_0812 [Candidatus Poribacteria bacterium]|nr:MAG: hypothetical protein KatS3mg115_0812 [Candidatus Poribacteria bacterium]
MADALFDVTTVEVRAGKYLFRASGSVVKFPGYLRLYTEAPEEESGEEGDSSGTPLPEVAQGEPLRPLEITPRQHFTEPPPRYTEASLVKALEELGIGRPSTYATIISTIQDRGYVRKVGGRFQPTDVGELVTKLLIRSFPEILDVGFTARMESELDEIEEGKRNWVAMLREFYEPFSALEKASDRMYEERKRLEEETEIRCEQCGRPMVVKWGRYGRFLGCSGYPECKNTRPLEGDRPRPEPVGTGVSCPKCQRGELMERRSRRGRTFYGCSEYPDCDFVIWDPPVPDLPCPRCGAPFLTPPSDQDSAVLSVLPSGGVRLSVGAGADLRGRTVRGGRRRVKPGSLRVSRPPVNGRVWPGVGVGEFSQRAHWLLGLPA